jgi:hypothetical protein
MPDHPEADHAELVAWLTERGKRPDEIATILAQVAEYDAQTVKESIFSSIGSLTDDEILKFLHEATGGAKPDEPK